MLPKENLESLIANCGFGQSSVDGGWWEWWPLGGSGKDEVVMVEEDGLTPRINGEIPDLSDATLDHERLSERLATYGLAELQMEGDGNCQFRALADQLFRNPDYHKHVRKKVVKQLKHFRKSYESYVPMKYRSYLKKMKKLGEWGDHITLQGAADCFEVKICLVTSFRDTCYIEILPKDKNPSRGSISYCSFYMHISVYLLVYDWSFLSPEIWLSFWSEVHYNSLYGVGADLDFSRHFTDVPTRAPRKKHWLF
ncbi:hypothetical protein RHGRI_010302 [Rhododendron griersonianum]|uniref:ubiquitinyl hydrolase 1 n=1 Tax=Rhododendron griersonianum TaxID=479676 RepID=A0AAV6KIM7_9ERIC|nr:hypothetical protein RHGRI_010302 [Rhododendron griersonianum]